MEGNTGPKPALREANSDLPDDSATVQPRKRSQVKAKATPKNASASATAIQGLRTKDQKLHRAEMLLNISREVAGIESLDDVLEKLVEITSRETGCERATLFLNDDQTGELYSRVAQGDIRREIRLLTPAASPATSSPPAKA